MKKLKLLIHCALLATTPTLLAYPHNPPPHTKTWSHPTTYDEILHLLNELDSGSQYSPAELMRINTYLAILAQAGAPSNDPTLEADIDHLLTNEDPEFHLAHNWEQDHTYILASNQLGYDIIQCGKLSKA